MKTPDCHSLRAASHTPDRGSCSRRDFIVLAGVGSLLPTRSRAAEGRDIALAEAVCHVATGREKLADGMSPFREGVAGRILAAMQQYLEVLDENRGATLSRLRAVRWALGVYTSATLRPSYGQSVAHEQLEGSVSAFDRGDPKCNKFVADAYAFGAGRGLSEGATYSGEGVGTGWPARRLGINIWPPLSNQLADPGLNLRSLSLAQEMRTSGDENSRPELGDAIAFPNLRSVGHVGLFLGHHLLISAKEGGVEIETLESEAAAHDGKIFIRKFNGSGR